MVLKFSVIFIYCLIKQIFARQFRETQRMLGDRDTEKTKTKIKTKLKEVFVLDSLRVWWSEVVK